MLKLTHMFAQRYMLCCCESLAIHRLFEPILGHQPSNAEVLVNNVLHLTGHALDHAMLKICGFFVTKLTFTN